jgi:hypothetical protein
MAYTLEEEEEIFIASLHGFPRYLSLKFRKHFLSPYTEYSTYRSHLHLITLIVLGDPHNSRILV